MSDTGKGYSIEATMQEKIDGLEFALRETIKAIENNKAIYDLGYCPSQAELHELWRNVEFAKKLLP